MAMFPKVTVVSQIPEEPQFSNVSTSKIPEVPIAPGMPLDASCLFLDLRSGLVVLGDVNERSGFLCKIGGFCLLKVLAGELAVISVVAFSDKEAAFIKCSGVADVSETAMSSTGVHVRSSGDSLLWVSCVCKGGQACDRLSPGGGVVIWSLLLHPSGPSLASWDSLRPSMQRAGFFGKIGFSGERSFLGLPALLFRFKSLCAVKSPEAALQFLIFKICLSFASTSLMLFDSIVPVSL